MKALFAFAGVLAALAFSVPVALGGNFTVDTLAPGGYSADTSGFTTDTLAPGGVSGSDLVARWMHNHQGDVVPSNAPSNAYNPRAYVPGNAPASVANAIQNDGYGRQQPVSQPVSQPVLAPSNGFSWGDAGIGAGVAAACLLALMCGMFLATRKPRRLAV